MTRLLFLDHEDSFSANLVAALRSLGVEVDVVTVTRGRDALPGVATPSDSVRLVEVYDGLVLSPGPGHPREHPATLQLCQALLTLPSPRPLLGVCLGLQCVAFAAGAEVRRVGRVPVHGRRVALDTTFDLGPALGGPLRVEGHVTLHNSLAVPREDPSFLAHFRVLAHEEGGILAAVSDVRPWLLCQFHPESFGSTAGMPFVEAFVRSIRSPK